MASMAPVLQPHEVARSLVSSFSTEIPTRLNLSSHISTMHPRDIDISSANPAELKSILDSTRTYQILAIWSPDLTAVVFCYFFAAMLKGSTEMLVRGGGVERAWAGVRGKKGTDGIEVADAQTRLSVPAKAATVLALQLYAWRLFVVPQTPIRIDDLEVLMVALKLLLVACAADLSSALSALIGQIAAYKTSELKFCRLAQWLILQATLEQAEYLALGCYHLSKYFSMQERPATARKMLRVAYRAMRVSSYVCWVQKFLPVGFAIYWLKRLWADVDYLPWGRAWRGMATAVLSLLLILQVRFCDDQSSLAAHFRHKLEGGPPPPRNGPVICFLLRIFRSRNRKAPSSPLPQHAQECTELEKGQRLVCGARCD
ncbi:hypothetical protein JCM10296v2_002061 [Rhodotorula toruloides]